MSSIEFKGINSFLVGMSEFLLNTCVERTTRGYKCFELPEPIVIKITNPLARYVTIPLRNWNCTLPYAESLWIATGRNDMELAGYYVKKLYDFSDDKNYMRAGYGPRIRKFNGVATDYTEKSFWQIFSKRDKTHTIDQFKFVECVFKRDAKTRQAIITIGDPSKDDFDLAGKLKATKDFPCTRTLQFILNNENKLDLIVHMRSNDFIWGASAVNIFNFTFMLEYMASILKQEVGNYYHIVNNFHFYEPHLDMIKQLAALKDVSDDDYYQYSKTFSNLTEFDTRLGELSHYEECLRKGKTIDAVFEDDFFSDWAKVFYCFKNNKKANFKNPILGQLINKKYAT